jgi:hypothetical protein
MIVGTLVVFKQLRFFRNTDLGFTKENVVVISSTNRLKQSEESFRQAISQMPGVTSASITSSIPSGGAFGDSYQPAPEGEQPSSEINLNSFIVDEEFVPTLNIKVLKGRNFSKEFSDSASIILNEEAVKQIGWKDPIGKWMDYPGGNNVRFKVIGVVKNFNIQSLQAVITPFALFYTTSKTYDLGTTNIIAKVNSTNLSHLVDQLQSKWKSFVSGEPFDYNFLDTAFNAIHFHRLHGIVWVKRFYGRETKERNWSAKGVGCICAKCCWITGKGFFETYFYCCDHSIPGCMVFYGQMAGRFCLQDQYKLDHFPGCRPRYIGDNINNYQLPGY